MLYEEVRTKFSLATRKADLSLNESKTFITKENKCTKVERSTSGLL